MRTNCSCGSRWNVFVIGVSGAVGGLLADELRARGDIVRGLVRRDEQRAGLAECGIDAVVGDRAPLLPTAELDDAVVRTAAATDPGLQNEVRELGHRRRLDHQKAGSVLGWTPRSTEEALIASAESILALEPADAAPGR